MAQAILKQLWASNLYASLLHADDIDSTSRIGEDITSPCFEYKTDAEITPPDETSGRDKRRGGVPNAVYHSLQYIDKADPHSLVEPQLYGEETDLGKQPFVIKVHPQVNILCDIHSHLLNAEIIGLLAGTWDAATGTLFIQAPYPCNSTDRDDDGSTDVELDPVAEIEARESIGARGLSVVGWYHSHPRFRPHPSITDIHNQYNYQNLFHDSSSSISPFVGLIVSTYDTGLQSAQSVHQWFRVTSYKPRHETIEVKLPMHLDILTASRCSTLPAFVTDEVFMSMQEKLLAIPLPESAPEGPSDSFPTTSETTPIPESEASQEPTKRRKRTKKEKKDTKETPLFHACGSEKSLTDAVSEESRRSKRHVVPVKHYCDAEMTELKKKKLAEIKAAKLGLPNPVTETNGTAEVQPLAANKKNTKKVVAPKSTKSASKKVTKVNKAQPMKPEPASQSRSGRAIKRKDVLDAEELGSAKKRVRKESAVASVPIAPVKKEATIRKERKKSEKKGHQKPSVAVVKNQKVVAKRIVKKVRAMRAVSNPSARRKLAKLSFLALLHENAQFAIAARSLLCNSSPYLRFLALGVVVLGLHYSIQKRKVDMKTQWKGFLKNDKIKESCRRWTRCIGIADAEQDTFLGSISSFISLVWYSTE